MKTEIIRTSDGYRLIIYSDTDWIQTIWFKLSAAELNALSFQINKQLDGSI